MNTDYESTYHQVEQNHFWFTSSRKLFLQSIQEKALDSHILDIGCSSGELLLSLKKLGYNNITGIDISDAAITRCKANNIHNVHVMDASNMSFNRHSFDIIIASNVIEHIENDSQAISNWEDYLKPGGLLIIMTSAFPILWSSHDENNHHYRRYTKKQFENLLSNFELVKLTYWNIFLFVPFCFFCIKDHWANKRSHKNNQPTETLSMPNLFINTFLTKLLLLENKIISYLNLPFGISLFSVARKKT